MDLAEAIATFQDACPVAFLATCDVDCPRVRQVSPVAAEGTTVYVAAFVSSDKMAQLAANPNVELCYLRSDHTQLRLRGAMHVCEDPATRRRMWQHYPLMQQYFPSADDPQYALLELRVARGLHAPPMSLDYQTLET